MASQMSPTYIYLLHEGRRVVMNRPNTLQQLRTFVRVYFEISTSYRMALLINAEPCHGDLIQGTMELHDSAYDLVRHATTIHVKVDYQYLPRYQETEHSVEATTQEPRRDPDLARDWAVASQQAIQNGSPAVMDDLELAWAVENNLLQSSGDQQSVTHQQLANDWAHAIEEATRSRSTAAMDDLELAWESLNEGDS